MKKSLGVLASIFMINVVPTNNLNLNGITDELDAKSQLQLRDLITFSQKPEIEDPYNFFYQKSVLEESPVYMNVKLKYFKNIIFPEFNVKNCDFEEDEDVNIILYPDFEKQQLILTVRSEYEKILEWFDGDKERGTITFTFWVKSNRKKISEDEIVYYPVSCYLSESLTSKKGNTKECRIINVTNIHLYYFWLEKHPTVTEQEFDQYKKGEATIIKWFGKDSKKHKDWIAEQRKKFANNSYRQVKQEDKEFYRKYEKISPTKVLINIKDHSVDFTKSYYVKGKVVGDNNFEEFKNPQARKSISQFRFKLMDPGIYKLYLEDRWENSYTSYIEIGDENWLLKGSINDPILIEMLREGNITFKFSDLNNFDLYSNANIYRKYWLMKYIDNLEEWIKDNLPDLVSQRLVDIAKGFGDQVRIKEIVEFLTSSLEVKKKS